MDGFKELAIFAWCRRVRGLLEFQKEFPKREIIKFQLTLNIFINLKIYS